MAIMGFRKSLVTLAAIAGVGLLLATAGGLWQAGKAADVAAHIYETRTAPTIELMKAVDALHRARQTILIALSEEKEEVAQAHLKKMEPLDAAMKLALRAYVTAAPDQREAITRLESLVADYSKARDQSVKMIEVGDPSSALENIKSNAGPKFDKVQTALSAVIQTQAQLALSDYEQAVASLKTQATVQIALALLALSGIGLMFYWIGAGIMRQLGGEPAEAVDVARAIAEGKLDSDIPLRAGDSTSLLANMKSMQEQLRARISAERKTAEENLRIRIALDNVSTGVMIADPQRNIIYTNKSVLRIMQGAEAGIKKSMPHFNAEKLVGLNIDSFHRNPQHQANLLAALVQPYTAQLVVGDHHMTVTANPVIDNQGVRLGVVAEWFDRTTEVEIENEVAEIVQAASLGSLSVRIDTQGKVGFFAKLGGEINALLDNTQRALEATSAVLNALAHGDLTRTVQGEYQGTFGQIKDDTNYTVQHLREVVGRIKEAADSIGTAAREISVGNQDLSSRTEEQASSLEETASSMEQLNVTVKQNAENALQANELAKNSNSIAGRGGEMVKRVVVTMEEIQEGSHQITDIISVIDSIAFQTNILALNAAVEAARAGEQGRGFAVVATEVRSLAQRSAVAAKEIKALIAKSVAKVESGAQLVQQAGATMDDVVSSFAEVAHLVTGISGAGREQSLGIEQITHAVSQMDEITQQNAALVEQAAAAAEGLQEQSQALIQAVSLFKLSESREVPVKVSLQAPRPPLLLSSRSAGMKQLPAKRANEIDEAQWSEF
jgi:methyl-accepting chemotaxis protein